MASPYTITVVEHSALRARGVALALAGPGLIPDQVRLRIRRWGYKKPFLHAGGWGVVESWLNIPAQMDDGGRVLKLPLAPDLAYYLEENSNYSVTFEVPGIPVIERPVRWSVSSKRRVAATAAPQPQPTPPEAIITTKTASGVAVPVSYLEAESAWQMARQLDSREAYSSFVRTYPDSSKITEAREAIDTIDRELQAAGEARAEELAWLVAKQAGSKNKFTDYLLAYPEGRFSDQAKGELQAFLPDRLIVTTTWSSTGRAAPFGADTCVFLLGSSGLVRNDRDMISSWVKDEATGTILSDSACGSVRNTGTSFDRTRNVGTETFAIDLNLVPNEIEVIAFTLSLDTRITGNVGLEAVLAELEVVDAARGQSLMKIPTEESNFGNKARVMLEIRRSAEDWVVQHTNALIKDGIHGICLRFGIAAG